MSMGVLCVSARLTSTAETRMDFSHICRRLQGFPKEWLESGSTNTCQVCEHADVCRFWHMRQKHSYFLHVVFISDTHDGSDCCSFSTCLRLRKRSYSHLLKYLCRQTDRQADRQAGACADRPWRNGCCRSSLCAGCTPAASDTRFLRPRWISGLCGETHSFRT